MSDYEDKIKISFDTNADQTKQSVDGVAKAVNNTTDAVEQQEKAQVSLRQQLRNANMELQNTINKYGETSKEAIASAKAVANLKDQMEFAQQLSKSFNPDQKFKALTSATQLAGTGLQGVTSGMALFGDQSKDTQAQLLKVQAAMAFSDAISNLSNVADQWKVLKTAIMSATIVQKANTAATGIAAITQRAFTGAVNTTTFGFKALKIALAATGIGLLVTGLAMVVANFDKISGAVMKAVPQLELVGKTIKNIFNGITDFIGITDKVQRKQDELLEGQKANAEKGLKQNERYLALNEHKLSESQKRQIELANQYFERVKNGELSYSESLKVYREGRAKDEIEANKKAQEKREEANKKRIETENTANEKANQIAKDNSSKEVELLKEKFERENLSYEDQRKKVLADTKLTKEDRLNLIKEIDKKEYDFNETQKQKLLDIEKEFAEKNARAKLKTKLDEINYEQEQELKKIENLKNNEKAKAEIIAYYDNQRKEDAEKKANEEFEKKLIKDEEDVKDFETKLELLAEQEELIKENKLLTEEEKQRLLKENGEKEIEIEKAIADQKRAITESQLKAGDSAVGFLKEIAGKNKAIQKAAIITESALGIGKAVISNNTANAGALATPQAIATSGAAAAPVIAFNNISTGLNIATIIAGTQKALQSLGGGSVSGGGATAQSPQGVSAQPQVGVQASSENQIATSIAKSQIEQAPIKAYVVSSDVTTAQNLDAKIISENSFLV